MTLTASDRRQLAAWSWLAEGHDLSARYGAGLLADVALVVVQDLAGGIGPHFPFGASARPAPPPPPVTQVHVRPRPTPDLLALQSWWDEAARKARACAPPAVLGRLGLDAVLFEVASILVTAGAVRASQVPDRIAGFEVPPRLLAFLDDVDARADARRAAPRMPWESPALLALRE